MALTRDDVAQRWKEGRPGVGSNMHTDGRSVFSYELQIGVTAEDGKKVAYEYTRSAGHFVSVTTTNHVSAVSKVADRVEEPPRPAKDVTRTWGGQS